MLRNFLYIALLLVTTLFVSPSPSIAIDNFIKYSSNPILSPTANSWDSERVWQPSVVFDGVEYKMYYSAYNGSRFQIGLAHSPDGITWQKDINNPIITRLNIDNKDSHDPNVIFDGSSYYMWYVSSENAGSSNFAIQRAYSSNGINWINDPILPVLKLTSGWGSIQGVSSPSVIKIGTTFKIWFSSPDSGQWSTGLSNSSDGITWTSYPLNPILLPTETWEDGQSASPDVTFDGAKYKMYYGGVSHIAYAESNDGVTWTKSPDDNPVLTVSQPFDSNRLGNANTIYLSNNTHAIYYDGNGDIDGTTTWRIGIALDGPLPPAPTPTSLPTPTPTSLPTPTPTPVSELNKSVIIIPGVAGSWNRDALLNCKTSGYTGNWTSWIKSDDTYQPLMRELENRGYSPKPFYYDWRKQVTTTAPLLTTFIQNTIPNGQTVDIVGHSLGGLVARAYLQNTQNNSRIEKLLTVGSAHQGAVVAYPAWSGGIVAGDIEWRLAAAIIQAKCMYDHRWLPRQSIRNSIPSIQNLLPVFDYLVDKKTNVSKSVSSMNAKNNWLPNMFNAPFFGVTVGTLAGTGQNTLRTLEVEAPNKTDKLLGNWLDGKPTNKQSFADGDGTVLVESAQLQDAQNMTAPLNHGALMYAPSGITAILNFLSGEPATPLVTARSLHPSEQTITTKNDTTALMIVVDGASASLTNKNGKVFKDSEGQITVVNPHDEAYMLSITPHINKWWSKPKYTVLVIQLFEDGTSTWKEYSHIDRFTKRWKVRFDRKSHHSDILRDR